MRNSITNQSKRSAVAFGVPFALVSLLFLLWGLANNMNDTLLAAFRRIMSMSDLQTSLVQFSFYGAYFCFALPAAIFISRHSYKAGIMLGLALYAAGTLLFFPAGEAASYGFFLFAIYVMAGGCAILETTANPYILSMGPAATATRRLNIAQTLNPVGAVCGILLSRHFILSELNAADAAERAGMDAEALRQVQAHELSAVSATYMLIGIVLLALLVVIAFVRMPSERSEGLSFRISESFRRLFANRRWRYGVVAQFFYVGVQTGVWSFTIRLAMARLGVLEREASMVFLYSILAFTAFRFLFTWLMAYVRPVRLLAVASVAAICCTLVVIADVPHHLRHRSRGRRGRRRQTRRLGSDNGHPRRCAHHAASGPSERFLRHRRLLLGARRLLRRSSPVCRCHPPQSANTIIKIVGTRGSYVRNTLIII